MTWRRLLLAVLASALLAGCSDDASKERDYIEGLDRIERTADQELAKAFATPATSVDDSRQRLEQADAAASKVAVGLKALEPPQRWARQHERLVARADQLQASSRVLTRAHEVGDQAGVARAEADVARHATALDDGIDAIRRDFTG